MNLKSFFVFSLIVIMAISATYLFTLLSSEVNTSTLLPIVFGYNSEISNGTSSFQIFNSSIPIALAAGDAYDPVTAIDPTSGTIYVIYIQKINNLTDLYLRKSVDGGKTFSTPVLVNDQEGDVSVMDNWSPQIAVSLNGTVYVLWTKTKFSPELDAKGFGGFGFSYLRFAKSADYGESFSPAINITAGTDGTLKSQILPLLFTGVIQVEWSKNVHLHIIGMFHGKPFVYSSLILALEDVKTMSLQDLVYSSSAERQSNNSF